MSFQYFVPFGLYKVLSYKYYSHTYHIHYFFKLEVGGGSFVNERFFERTERRRVCQFSELQFISYNSMVLKFDVALLCELKNEKVYAIRF